jgi:hypothetical protein
LSIVVMLTFAGGTAGQYLGGRLDCGQLVRLEIGMMATAQDLFDGVLVVAGAQFLIRQPREDIPCADLIGLSHHATHPAAKRLLIGAIGTGDK